MRNINKNNITEKNSKKVYNFVAEKLVREANDNFIYFRDYEVSLEQVNRALIAEPDHIKALILKGDILLGTDRDYEALEYFDKAINADPYSAEAYRSKAGTLDIQGKQKEALYCCEKAFENLTLKDKHLLPSLYERKIAILVRVKKYEKAREALKKCVKILPEEDGSYLISCYQNLIESSYKEQKRKREMLIKLSLKVVN